MSHEKLKILCVDDEPQVVNGLRRHLEGRYKVLTAESGAEGLRLAKEHADLAIVLSDMRMPEIDGALLLKQVRAVRPDAIRLLLTGYADIRAAIAAINEGQVFRFMVKPCAPDELSAVLRESEAQYYLVTAEKTLLHRTLVGTVKALIEVMSWSNPVAMGRAARLRRRVAAMAEEMRVERRWVAEVAALFSEIGTLSLPPELAEKLDRWQPLEEAELAKVHEARRAANRMLAQIPRLQPVGELLDRAFTCPPAADATEHMANTKDDPLVPLLRLAADLERGEANQSIDAAISQARSRSAYSSTLLNAAEKAVGSESSTAARRLVAIKELQTGMVLDDDILTVRGLMIAPKGVEITASFLEHITRFSGRLRDRPIAVIEGKETSNDQLSEVPGIELAKGRNQT